MKTRPSNSTHYVELHYLFGLWNPHQQNPTTQTTYNRPAIRLCIQTNGGNTIGCASGWATNSTPYTTANGLGPIPISTNPPMYGYSLQLSPGSTTVQLASGTQGHGANGFLNPGPLTSADVSSATARSPNGVNTFTSANGGANSVVAPLPSGWASLTIGSTSLYTYELPDLQINLATSPAPVNDSLQDYGVPYEGQQFQILLEYNDAPNGGTGGNWIPYDYWNGINDPLTSLTGPGTSLSYCVYIPTQSGASNTPASYTLPSPPSYFYTLTPAWGPPSTYMTCDPRTFRFNPWELIASMVLPVDSLWSGWASGALPQYTTAGYGGAVGTGYLDYAQQWPSNFVTANYFPATLCRNNSPFSPNNTSASSYPDPDGVQRIADSGLFPASTTSSTGNPFYDPTVNPNLTASGLGPGGQREADRPIILNRPFNHVADLGYAFRDDPWRSLDFFSAYNGTSTSADSGLLDLFSVREEPAMVAGRVDLNTQNATVLQSVLSQTVIDVLGNVTGTAYTTNNTSAVTALATQMTSFTSGTVAGTGPLVNKDQLVTKLNPALTASALASSVSTGNPTDPQNIKACREAFVRTLADVGQTRTWNLMIDLVAQAGRYPPTANSLDQFVVEGEKRYWLHVAIDRFTGKVIDERIEPVSE